MTLTLPASSHKCRETRPPRTALPRRPSGRSRLLRNDPSTITSPAPTAADPDKPGRPRNDRHRQLHNRSPPALTRARVQINDIVASQDLAPLRLDGNRRPPPLPESLLDSSLSAIWPLPSARTDRVPPRALALPL